MRQSAIMSLLVLLLAACTAASTDTESNPAFVTATHVPAERTESMPDTADSAAYDPATIDLSASYTFMLPWRTRISLNYPENWQLNESSRVTIFSPDAYNFLISGSDDPAGRLNALQALDNINQTASIDTREIDGQTVHISQIQSGNALAAAVPLNESDYVLIQMISRRGNDIERMRPLLARLGASVRVVDTPDDS